MTLEPPSSSCTAQLAQLCVLLHLQSFLLGNRYLKVPVVTSLMPSGGTKPGTCFLTHFLTSSRFWETLCPQSSSLVTESSQQGVSLVQCRRERREVTCTLARALALGQSVLAKYYTDNRQYQARAQRQRHTLYILRNDTISPWRCTNIMSGHAS